MELYLCVLFRNVIELKTLFTQFRKTCLKQKAVQFRVSPQELSLYQCEHIEQHFTLNGREVIQQVKMSGDSVAMTFKDFDSVVQTVSQLVANPLDARIYFEQTTDALYLTWSVTHQDQTIITKQSEVEIIHGAYQPMEPLQPMLMMPTWVLSNMANIANKLDTGLKMQFYQYQDQYSLELEVLIPQELPQFKTTYKCHDNCIQADCFFEVNRHFCHQLIEILSLEETVALGVQPSITSPLALMYYSGEDTEQIGMMKQFIIPRMYN